MELLIVIIVLALLFDFINGFHDAANSIATIVSTKVLTPFQAVLWAAFFNFVAFFIAKYIIGGFGIANTVSKTVVEEFITLPIILSGVIAAIVERYPLLFFSYPYRRICRCCHYGEWIRGDSAQYYSQNSRIYFLGSIYRNGRSVRIYDIGPSYLSPGSTP